MWSGSYGRCLFTISQQHSCRTPPIIFLDNIDRLLPEQQSYALRYIHSFHSSITSYAATVIAIREENIFREIEPEEKGVSQQLLSRILLEHHGRTFHPSVDVPYINDVQLKNLINKRLAFTKKVQELQQVKVEEGKKTVLQAAQVGRISDPKQQELSRLEGELNYFLPIITEASYSHIQRLAERVYESFARINVALLCNNSIRDMMLLFRDCIDYLLRSKNPERVPPEALEYEDWFITTLVLSYLYNSRRQYQLELFDIVRDSENWFNLQNDEPGCFLEYLAVTTTWNIMIERKQGSPSFSGPTVGEVIEKIEKLGYGRERIRRRLHDLYLYNGARGHMLEVRSRALIERPGGLTDDLEVYITSRGKCLVTFIAHTYGYLLECMRHAQFADDLSELLPHASFGSEQDHYEDILYFLARIAQMHFDSLKQIRENGNIGNEYSWLTEYYLSYGVPLVKPYFSRKQGLTVGKRIGGFQRSLQFELLIHTIVAYLEGKINTTKLRKLQNEFTNAVERLGDTNKRDPKIDFVRKIGAQRPKYLDEYEPSAGEIDQ